MNDIKHLFYQFAALMIDNLPPILIHVAFIIAPAGVVRMRSHCGVDVQRDAIGHNGVAISNSNVPIARFPFMGSSDAGLKVGSYPVVYNVLYNSPRACALVARTRTTTTFSPITDCGLLIPGFWLNTCTCVNETPPLTRILIRCRNVNCICRSQSANY